MKVKPLPELSVVPPKLLIRTLGRETDVTDQLDEVLKLRYIYVPRGEKKDTIQLGKPFGFAVAQGHGAHPTVVAARKASATFHPELARLDIVTERSGYPHDGGVVLAWCPTYKVMERIQHLEKSVVVLVEWTPGEFDAWAKLVGAYKVTTGDVMDAGLSADAMKALERIGYERYNGWTKSTDVQLTGSLLDDLAEAGAHDRELVLAFARHTKSESNVDRLKKIMDKFEASRASSTTSAPWFPTSRDW